MLLTRAANKVSGAEMYNRYLLPYLRQKKDVSLHMFTNNRDFATLMRKYNIPSTYTKKMLHEIGTKRELIFSLFFIPSYISFMLSKLKKNKIIEKKNIVVMQSMTEKLFLTGFLKLQRYKVVWVEHGPVFTTQRAAVIKELYKRVSRFVDVIVAVSEDTMRDLVQGQVAKQKVEVIYIGLDIKKWVNGKREKVIEKKIRKRAKHTIGFVGTVGKEKGILRFIETAEYIIKEMNTVLFLVVGDGPLLKTAQRIVKEKAMEKYFYFTGYKKDVMPYLDRSDIVFLPTDHAEGLSLAILEAMARGKVVVTHTIGGNAELVKHNRTGILYKTFNRDKISKILLSLLSDEKKRKDMGLHAMTLVRNNFDIRKNSQLFYTTMKNL